MDTYFQNLLIYMLVDIENWSDRHIITIIETLESLQSSMSLKTDFMHLQIFHMFHVYSFVGLDLFKANYNLNENFSLQTPFKVYKLHL